MCARFGGLTPAQVARGAGISPFRRFKSSGRHKPKTKKRMMLVFIILFAAAIIGAVVDNWDAFRELLNYNVEDDERL